MRSILAGVAAAATMVGTAVLSGGSVGGASPEPSQAAAAADAATPADYVVLYRQGTDGAAAKAVVAAAGAHVVSQNAAIGYLVVRSDSVAFANSMNASSAVEGVARNRVIGAAPQNAHPVRDEVERLTAAERAAAAKQAPSVPAQAGAAAAPPAEPLAGLQWDMRQIGATSAGSYAQQPGDRGVLVGVIDTGIDGSHPDVAPNFDQSLSRNFVVDIPSVDGPCEVPSCIDPVGVDDDGHGTHVASEIAAPINGLGMAGVAPNVTLVNIRAGQDSGFFFLAPTLAALTYAGEIGVDVVNMSFFTDPWLYNCTNNPADSPAEQAEQRTIRVATQRAINFARGHGVLPVAAEGNEATDLNAPTVDETSPDFPPGNEKSRTVDNTCITVPSETRGVVTVSSTGISTRKAYYSNYGTQETDIAAPGGDAYDTPDNTLDPRDAVLGAYPTRLAQLNGDLNPDGTPNNPFVVQSCDTAGTCAYYQYLQGTSMASPHTVGVAALIVSQFGRADAVHGGLTLDPARTQSILYDSAVEHACPQPRLLHYTRITAAGVMESDAFCAGGIARNGFYGRGIVNAFAAVAGER